MPPPNRPTRNQMKPTALLAVLAAAGIASSAQASTVLFSSRPDTQPSNYATAEGYRNHWMAALAANPVAPAGYGEAQIQTWDSTNPMTPSNQGLIPGGSSERIAFKYQVDFCVDEMKDGSRFDFRIAPDFAYGGAAFLDGVAVDWSSDDLWWGENWTNSAAILEFSASLASGNHTLVVYGQEECCDGGTSGQFAINGGDWNSFGTKDGLDCDRPNTVPESGPSLALLAGGLGLVMAARRIVRTRQS
ncbi:MAG: CCXG family PEP-CTERM protein [Verrucomicrobiales bacterium]